MNNAFKWGAIMAVGLIIASLATHYTGLSSPDSMGGGIIASLLSWVISIGAIVMGIKSYKQANGGFLTLGNGMSQGVLIGLFGGILVAVFTYVFFSFIAPESMDNFKDAAMAGAEEAGGEQEEMVGNIMDAMFSPGSMAMMSMIGNLIFGFIVGLVSGLIMKNERSQGTL